MYGKKIVSAVAALGMATGKFETAPLGSGRH